MSKVIATYNNWSRGQADHDLNGRFDLGIYKSSSEVFKNFISNFKGNAIYRTGFENMGEFEDCRFIEFRFNQEQDYLALFYAGGIKFLSYDSSGNFGLVQSAGADLEVANPYTLAQCKELDFTQNADVMYVVHEDVAPYKLTRVSATSFTFATYVRTADPFDNPAVGTTGYPAKVEFYEGRLYYGASTLKITNIWASKTGSYDDMTTGTGDDDGLAFQIADITEGISWLKQAQNSLVAGSGEGLVPINGGGVNTPITPSNVTAKLSQTDGSDTTRPITKDNLLFYIKYDRRNIHYFNYNLLSENFEAQDANAVSYDITASRISKLVYKKDKNNLIYTITDDGDLLSLNFNQKEKIVGWHKHETEGTFIDIVQMYNNNKEIQLFALVQRTNGIFIERLADFLEFPLPNEFYTGVKATDEEAYIRFISERLKDAIYLDNSTKFSDLRTATVTYDGASTVTADASSFVVGDVGRRIVYRTSTGAEKGVFEITAFVTDKIVTVSVLATPTANVYSDWYMSFTSISGLTEFASTEVSVVGDGGYLEEFTVDAFGVLTLDRQVTVAVVGFKYEGLIQSFLMGFQVQLTNTQVLIKNITRSILRFVFSAGGEFGSSLYNMEKIQDYQTGGGYYDLPPLPMDGDKKVSYSDDAELDKKFYIRQTIPVPLNLTAVFSDVKFGNKT